MITLKDEFVEVLKENDVNFEVLDEVNHNVYTTRFSSEDTLKDCALKLKELNKKIYFYDIGELKIFNIEAEDIKAYYVRFQTEPLK